MAACAIVGTTVSMVILLKLKNKNEGVFILLHLKQDNVIIPVPSILKGWEDNRGSGLRYCKAVYLANYGLRCCRWSSPEVNQ